jgi:hypothetical protein
LRSRSPKRALLCRPAIDDVVVVLEDLNECLNGTPDSAQLIRNASLNRVAKGNYKAGFAPPASLVRQAHALPQRPRQHDSGSRSNANVAKVRAAVTPTCRSCMRSVR